MFLDAPKLTKSRGVNMRSLYKVKLQMVVIVILMIVIIVQGIVSDHNIRNSGTDRLNVQSAMTGFLSNLHWAETAMTHYRYLDGHATAMQYMNIKSTLSDSAGILTGLYPYLYIKYGNQNLSNLSNIFNLAWEIIPPNPHQLSKNDISQIYQWLKYVYSSVSENKVNSVQSLLLNANAMVEHAPKVLTNIIG